MNPSGTRVVFIDSGIGGIPYMLHALDHIAEIEGIYLADTGFFPYGTRDPEELRTRLRSQVAQLEDRFDPALYVLACNTASVVGLAELRKSFSKPFVGTVPAVKPAARISPPETIGLMATSQTVRDPYLDELVKSYLPRTDLQRVSATELIEEIEHNFFSMTPQPILKSIGEEFVRGGRDTVILGCTHFLHLETHMNEIWGKNIRTVDSREGITRQIMRLLQGLPQDSMPELVRTEDRGRSQRERSHFLISSSEREEYYRKIAEHFSLGYGGLL